MTPQDIFRISHEIQSALIEYWHDVDTNWGARAHEFYTEDGSYTTSARTRQGRAVIAEFYSSRRDRGARISRHLVSNVRVQVQDDTHATCSWVLVLYAADGEPVLTAEVPNLIADCHDVLVREADGQWRCASRRLVPLFKSSTPTTA
ncbi:MAG: nuclear transport factor 2 family protein [Hydrogenophaga sp.]|nr:nuclear transport factor 2 family protein [Hydrogenophaga sp.]